MGRAGMLMPAMRGGSMDANGKVRIAVAIIVLGVAVARNAGASPDINQHGLTGSYYNAATNGQGFQLEVFQDMVAAGQGYAQVSWFSFANAGGSQRWYTMGGYTYTGRSSVDLTIYQNTGGNFATPLVMGGIAKLPPVF
jgi:hypothetical protein